MNYDANIIFPADIPLIAQTVLSPYFMVHVDKHTDEVFLYFFRYTIMKSHIEPIEQVFKVGIASQELLEVPRDIAIPVSLANLF